MEKNKVTKLAQSFSTACKQVVKSDQIARVITSPAVMLIALTVLEVMVEEGGIDKKPGWGIF